MSHIYDHGQTRASQQFQIDVHHLLMCEAVREGRVQLKENVKVKQRV